MTTKKIPISFNDENQAEIKQLIDLLGLVDCYGDVPQAIKFSIHYTLSAIKDHAKVYPNQNPEMLAKFFDSVKQQHKINYFLDQATEKIKTPEKSKNSIT